jgi:hypothetical protein
MNDSLEAKQKELLDTFQAGLAGCALRATRTKVHGIIPYRYFSIASSECRHMFIYGQFYGCISLAQAVAEALARFVARHHQVRVAKDPRLMVARLRKANRISEQCSEAFLVIWGDDRNDFHHLNEDVELDYATLEARAEDCVSQLYVIESELFAYEVPDGGLRPLKPEYWPESGGTYGVFLRLID